MHTLRLTVPREPCGRHLAAASAGMGPSFRPRSEELKMREGSLLLWTGRELCQSCALAGLCCNFHVWPLDSALCSASGARPAAL